MSVCNIMLSSDRSIVYPFALILGSLAKGELNMIVLRTNFQQTSNQSRTIIKPPTVSLSYENPQHYQRSEQSAATRHKICIAPSLNPDRSAILRKSATLLKVGTVSGDSPLRVGRLSCRSAFLSFPSQDTGRLSTCRKPHRLCFGFRPRCSFQS